jgi:hypothetical protein
MKKTTTLIICLLAVTGVLIYGFFMYKSLKKKYTRYVDYVHRSADNRLYVLLLKYQNNNRILNDYCKSDTVPPITKNDFYSSMAMETRGRECDRELFGLLAELHYSVNYSAKNREEIYKIRNEYDDQFSNLWTFYLFHHNFSDLKTGAIDSLISYNKKLVSCIEQLQKIEIKP